MKTPAAVLILLVAVVAVLLGVLRLAGAGQSVRWEDDAVPDVVRGGELTHTLSVPASVDAPRAGAAARLAGSGPTRGGRACSTLVLQENECESCGAEAAATS